MSFNFAVILFWLLVATGAIWLLDALILKPRRRVAANEALRQFDQQAQTPGSAPVDQAGVIEERKRLRERYLRQPGWIEFPAGFFPVILV
ncbi:MAG: signal peptidase I, partial [Burkholderiaceae bacterium]